MRKTVLKVCSMGFGLLVMAFLVGSCNVHNLKEGKSGIKTTEAKGASPAAASRTVSRVLFSPRNTRSATSSVMSKCTAVVRPNKKQEIHEYRTLNIPQEHLMVRSGYQQLGRLALIYAHCAQYMRMVRDGIPINYPVERKRLVMMNQKLINQCVIQYTKLQTRGRSVA